MKKLKQMSGPYSIGFELSSTAHGFVATDPNGNVLYHGKQPVMGTRVFKEGQPAAEARMPRTSRRGIQRRRGREHEMERVFAPVISSIDPDFFIRRRMSYKLGKIRFESDPIGFSYSRLFHSFPTLAHLDVALMESDSAMDPRLIFEAVANHVVRRGHFLLENQNVSSTNSDIDTQVANYAEVLVSYFEDTLDERIELSLEALDINGNVTARELQKQFASAMCVSGDDIQKKTEKAQIKAIADLVTGYKADLTVLVPDAEKLPKVSISDGDALEEFLADSCPDSLVPVLMAAQALYTSWKLQGMLSYAPGKSLSHNQVAQHDVAPGSDQVAWRPVITLSASEMIFKGRQQLFMVVERQNPIILIFRNGTVFDIALFHEGAVDALRPLFNCSIEFTGGLDVARAGEEKILK